MTGPEGDAHKRRRYHRAPKKSLVSHKVLDFGAQDAGGETSRMRDLSPSGVRFHSQTDYPPGALLQLDLDLPGWEKEKIDFFKSDPDEALKPLVVLAEVRWVKPDPAGDGFEVGALFVNIDEWHRKALVAYLEKLGWKGEEA